MNNKQLLQNLIKNMLLAIPVGIGIGMIEALFGNILNAILKFRVPYHMFLTPLLPLGGLLITWIYYHYSKLSLKGMTLVFEAGQQKRDTIPLILIPIVMLSTWITHICGGSAGREGVAVQIGATFSNFVSRKFHLPEKGHTMLITGMAAGFAGLFQTPLTAVFFAMEVLISGYMDYEAILPAFIGAGSACLTSHYLGINKFEMKIDASINIYDLKTLAILVLLGIIFGIAGRLFAYTLENAKALFAEKIENPFIRIAACSIPLAVIMFVTAGRYSGLGSNLVSAAFTNGTVYPWDWLMKLLLTVLTLGIGFQGGEVTPLFTIGTTLGYIVGSLLGISPVLTAALGYSAVFGSGTNTIIAPMLIGMEIFGTANMPAFVIVCAIAYAINGNTSIYAAQQNAAILKKAM